MKHPLLLLLVALVAIHSCVGEGEKPPHEETRQDDTVMFGDTEVKLSPQLMEAWRVMQQEDALSKMGPMLARTYKEHQETNLEGSSQESFVHDDGTVSIDVVALGGGPEMRDMLKELEPHGFTLSSTYRHMASGTIPITSLGEMCKCSTVLMAMPAMATVESLGEPSIQRRRTTGSVTSEGVFAMEVDKVLENLGFNGSGITVGVLSDSFNALGGAKEDVASGDLPPANRINILNDSIIEASDEGRAMMQIVHDVAPGANLAFHTAFGGIASFANGILKLAKAGCQIIVDDVFNSFEPAFQDGLIAQAVDKVRESGVIYFASAGNYGRSAYESAFVDSGEVLDAFGTVYRLHDWAYGSNSVPDLSHTIFLPNSERVVLIFQWDEPFASATPGSRGSSSDLGMFIRDPIQNKFVAISDQINIGRDPIEIISLNVTAYLQTIGRPTESGYNFEIGIGLSRGKPPKIMKVTSFSSRVRFMEYPTNSGSGYGHRNARGSIAIAATNWESTPRFGLDPPVVRSYSSALGTPILFDTKGKRLAKPEVRQQPKVTGPDGGINTFFPTPDFPRFQGTSAAAPHVAAVAALMLEADPTLRRNEIKDILKKTAIGMSDPMIPFSEEKRFDFRTGHGFVNASAAFEELLSRQSKEDTTRNLRVGSTIKVLA